MMNGLVTSTHLLACAGSTLLHTARHRLGRRRSPSRQRPHPDAGTTTEYVILTALLAAAAITIAGIIVAKLVARANSISL